MRQSVYYFDSDGKVGRYVVLRKRLDSNHTILISMADTISCVCNSQGVVDEADVGVELTTHEERGRGDGRGDRLSIFLIVCLLFILSAYI